MQPAGVMGTMCGEARAPILRSGFISSSDVGRLDRRGHEPQFRERDAVEHVRTAALLTHPPDDHPPLRTQETHVERSRGAVTGVIEVTHVGSRQRGIRSEGRKLHVSMLHSVDILAAEKVALIA